jgi:hypothetical protein
MAAHRRDAAGDFVGVFATAKPLGARLVDRVLFRRSGDRPASAGEPRPPGAVTELLGLRGEPPHPADSGIVFLEFDDGPWHIAHHIVGVLAELNGVLHAAIACLLLGCPVRGPVTSGNPGPP